MIRTLSPYYVTTSFVSPASGETTPSYTLQLFVWSGQKASPPSTPQYEKTKINYESSTGNGKLDISKEIRDYIDFQIPSTFTPVEEVNFFAGTNQVWAKWQILYNTGDPLDASAQLATTKLASRGFSYGNEGENVDDVITISTTVSKMNSNGLVCIPIYLSDVGTTAVDVISYPSNEINDLNVFSLSTSSDFILRYCLISPSYTAPLQDKEIRITRAGVLIHTIYLEDECNYTPVDIFFQNKNGCLETMTFFKEQKSSNNVIDSMYEGNNGQPNLGNHQFTRYNVNGSEMLSLNTGFIDETNNEKIKQLLLSEKIWKYDSGDYIPLNIETKSVEYKTRVNDKLINYKIDFKYSYNLINNI